jgi:AcrR family transcriptional regulator
MSKAPSSTLRFAEKRELILDGAAALFNRRGIKAGTLAEVAASVGLATNSLTYYYRKKEDLVVACLLRSIAALDGVIADADAHAPPGDLAGRVRMLVQRYIALLAAIEDRLRPALIFFGDMRALPQPQAEPAFAAYVAMFRRLRALLHAGAAGAGVPLPPARSPARRALNARCHGLLSQLLWARAWLGRYETSDYPRVANAVVDILLGGLAAPGQRWPDAPLPAPLPPADAADADGATDNATREAYLRTATRLVNDHGVGGASVERIAATLDLTKGSFYHHHDTKNALIDDCFERSFALIRGVQWAAIEGAHGAAPANGWQTLLAATLPLAALQTSPQGPLLRLTAWTELPGALRWQKYTTLNRLAERYAALVVAGQADGSLRLVDPAVAAQLICGLVNGLAEVEHWLPGDGPPDLQPLLARPLLQGLLAAPAA